MMRSIFSDFFSCYNSLVKSLCYSDKQQFVNFDGSVVVQPLVGIYSPRNELLPISQFINQPLIEEFNVPWRDRLLKAEDQISALVHFAHSRGLKVRGVGTGASWSTVTKTQDILIESTCLNQIVSRTVERVWCERDAKSYNTVLVQAGMIVRDFCREIDSKFGLALPILGNYAGQTVAGLVATSSHGSSNSCYTMANYVHALYMVTEGGVKIKVRYQQPEEEAPSLDQISSTISRLIDHFDPSHQPIEIPSDDLMHAAAVSLGCFGVVYALEFYCEATYNIQEVRTALNIQMPGPDARRIQFPELIQRGLHDLTDEDTHFFSFFVNPFADEEGQLRCTVMQGKKCRDFSANPPMRDERCKCPLCYVTCGLACERRGLNTTLQFIQSDASAAAMHAVNLCGSERVKREALTFSMYGFEHCEPRVDKWFEILQMTGGNIHVRTAELCVPLDSVEEALLDVIRTTNKYCAQFGHTSLLPIFVRTMRADRLLLSPTNALRPDHSTCHQYAFIEVPFLPGSHGVDEYHAILENALVGKYRARPHWAKNNFLDSGKVDAIYPLVHQWRTFGSVLNRSGTFSNGFSDSCGLTSLYAQPARKISRSHLTQLL